MNNFAKNAQRIKLDKESIYLRKLIFTCFKSQGRGHLGPAFSIVEILRVLYSKYIKKNKSKFILSKGHGCLALYATLYQHGYIKKIDLLNTGKFNSILGGHPEHDKIPGVEVSTGSLGHGLPIAVGMAIGSKLRKKNNFFFVLCGDGEMNEGSNWEALLSAAKHKLYNLVLLIDYNKFQSYGPTSQILNLEPLTQKLKSFGLKVFNVNGHDMISINKILKISTKNKKSPTAIICHTIKGKGYKDAENNSEWHHKSSIGKNELADIEKNFNS